MSACLRAKLLGGFSVYWGDVPLVEPGSRINKNVELLALLLVGDKQPLDNQQLMEALWEGEAANPAGALKNAVYSLRRLLEQAAPGVSFIRTAGQHYQLEPGLAVELDTAEFSRQAEAALADGLPDAEKLAACRRALEGESAAEEIPEEIPAPEEEARPRRRLDLALAADLIASAGMLTAVAAVAVRFFLG